MAKMKQPHSSIKHTNVRIEENQTAINPALPPTGSKPTTKNDFDVNRGAAMTGTKAPKDPTNINGNFPGGR